jgi:hypothetical protein
MASFIFEDSSREQHDNATLDSHPFSLLPLHFTEFWYENQPDFMVWPIAGIPLPPQAPPPQSHASNQAFINSSHLFKPSTRMLPLEAHISLPPLATAPSNFGAIHSTIATAHYSPHQSLAQSSAPCSFVSQPSASLPHTQHQPSITTATTSPSGQIGMSQNTVFIPALSGAGEGVNPCRHLVRNALHNQKWQNLLGML